MKFTDALFEDIKKNNEKSNFEAVIEELKQTEVIGIWGTGLAGTMIDEAFKRLGIETQFFLDNNQDKIGTYFRDKIVKSITEIPLQAKIIIAANVKYGIHRQLQEAAIKNYTYIDPAYLYLWNLNVDIIDILKENRHQIDDVYNLLIDDESKKVYRNVLLHRVIHNIELIWDIYDEHQYFGNNIVRKAVGGFIDCGAFRGDTLKIFLNQIGDNEYRYFAFEADCDNYEILKNYCIENSLDNVYPINLGVWDKKEQLYFQSNIVTGEVSGKIIRNKESVNVEKILVDTIDSVLPCEDINFIKMDIEGAEIKALHGARNTIARCKPILAISAYHELEHLWEIPLLIKEFNNNYEIHFGHHMWNMADTVCYGLIK